MSLLIDVQEVPWRILEMVKARILANRQRLADRQQAQDVRGLTRPRPQRKQFGATMSTYRRPEPVGLPAEDGKSWLLVPSDLQLTAKVRGIRPFTFIQYTSPGAELFRVDIYGGPDGQPYIEGVAGTGQTQAYVELTARGKPSSGAITEECFYYIADTSPSGTFFNEMVINFSSIALVCQTIRNTTISRVVRTAFIRDHATDLNLYRRDYVSEYDDFDAPFFPDLIRNDTFTTYGKHHAACVVNTVGASVVISLYIDGVRILLSDPIPAAAYWSGFIARSLLQIRSEGLGFTPGSALHRVGGLRYTERALYKGDTYTVPTTITRMV